jgi:hypothetical protein
MPAHGHPPPHLGFHLDSEDFPRPTRDSRLGHQVACDPYPSPTCGRAGAPHRATGRPRSRLIQANPQPRAASNPTSRQGVVISHRDTTNSTGVSASSGPSVPSRKGAREKYSRYPCGTECVWKNGFAEVPSARAYPKPLAVRRGSVDPKRLSTRYGAFPGMAVPVDCNESITTPFRLPEMRTIWWTVSPVGPGTGTVVSLPEATTAGPR